MGSASVVRIRPMKHKSILTRAQLAINTCSVKILINKKVEFKSCSYLPNWKGKIPPKKVIQSISVVAKSYQPITLPPPNALSVRGV